MSELQFFYKPLSEKYMRYLALRRIILAALIYTMLMVAPLAAQGGKNCGSQQRTGGQNQSFSGMGLSQFSGRSSTSMSVPFNQTGTMQTPFMQSGGPQPNFRKCTGTQPSTIQGGFQTPFSPGSGMQIPLTQNGNFLTPFQQNNMQLPFNQGYGVQTPYNQAITQQIAMVQMANYQYALMQANRRNSTSPGQNVSQQNDSQNTMQQTMNSGNIIYSMSQQGIPIFSTPTLP